MPALEITLGAIELAAAVKFISNADLNCRWMEANMFTRADIQRSLKRFVRVRLYTDGLGEPFTSQRALEQRFSV